jgi:uncharacterized damage-inducible protein DinB
MSIRLFFDQWPIYNERIVEVVREMSPEQLAIRPAPSRWPIWATVGHTAGLRVYWLCGFLGEPGAETTPVPEMAVEGLGWEDDLDRPRSADELVTALETTWRLIDRCLDQWTPDMMSDEFSREMEDHIQVHTRTSVLQRMFSHDAYHSGELSQTLGIEQLPQIDLWATRPGQPGWRAKP